MQRKREMARRRLCRTCHVLLVEAACFTVLPSWAGAAASRGGAPESPKVLVATTGNHSERIRTIPITRQPGREKRAVMSMKPDELPDFVTGDRVKVTAEVQFTVNCVNDGFPRCVGPAYKYNPVIHTSLLLTGGKNTTGGKRSTRISGDKRNICRQRPPRREHHCVITFTHAGFTVQEGKPPRCWPDTCRINLVASASNPSARGGDLLMVGGQRPDGSIPQDRGRINAIRFHPADQPRIEGEKSDKRFDRRVDPDFHKHVVYSMQLNELEAGEQLEASGKLRTEISGLPYNLRESVQLILTARRQATHPNDAVRRAATLGGEVDELNGFNCTRNRPSCVISKVGVVQIERDLDQPLFVNLVTIVGPKKTRPRPGDHVKIGDGGHVRVVRYPPHLHG
ncbi:MAG TPA: hypothetical protein VE401_03040 [Solirubrobacterales bacterium]|jgi:hypothetical protein|nr:hypothetical protein [Solirubrobacterales bacterium]